MYVAKIIRGSPFLMANGAYLHLEPVGTTQSGLLNQEREPAVVTKTLLEYMIFTSNLEAAAKVQLKHRSS